MPAKRSRPCTGSIHGKHFGGRFGVSFGEASKIGGGGQIAERGMRANRVVNAFPLPEFLIEFRHRLRFFFEQVVELLVIGFVASFDQAVVLGAMGVREEVGKRVGAGFFEEAEELGAVVGVEVEEGEGEGGFNLGQEALGGFGGGGGVSAEDAEASAGVHGGELIDFGAVGEAEVFSVELEEGAGSGLVNLAWGAQTLAVEAAQVFLAGFGEEEVVAGDNASDGGGGEGEAVALLEENRELVFGPGRELFSEGDDLFHGVLRQGRGAEAFWPSGAVFEGGEIAGVEAGLPLVEGSGREGEVPAGEAGVMVMGVVEVKPGEAALGGGGKAEVSGQMVERAREGKDTHGDLLLETPILAAERG